MEFTCPNVTISCVCMHASYVSVVLFTFTVASCEMRAHHNACKVEKELKGCDCKRQSFRN